MARQPTVARACCIGQFDRQRAGPIMPCPSSPSPVDFAFTQQMSPELGPYGWRPVFLALIYTWVSRTRPHSAPTAVSMPTVTHRAKYTMLVQSSVALALFGSSWPEPVSAFT